MTTKTTINKKKIQLFIDIVITGSHKSGTSGRNILCATFNAALLQLIQNGCAFLFVIIEFLKAVLQLASKLFTRVNTIIFHIHFARFNTVEILVSNNKLSL